VIARRALANRRGVERHWQSLRNSDERVQRKQNDALAAGAEDNVFLRGTHESADRVEGVPVISAMS
jgi:hypothetical protein